MTESSRRKNAKCTLGETSQFGTRSVSFVTHTSRWPYPYNNVRLLEVRITSKMYAQLVHLNRWRFISMKIIYIYHEPSLFSYHDLVMNAPLVMID